MSGVGSGGVRPLEELLAGQNLLFSMRFPHGKESGTNMMHIDPRDVSCVVYLRTPNSDHVRSREALHHEIIALKSDCSFGIAQMTSLVVRATRGAVESNDLHLVPAMTLFERTTRSPLPRSPNGRNRVCFLGSKT